MRLSLAITTYERPDALAAVLATLARQSRFPDELIIADDGSGAGTRAVVERFSNAVTFPVHFVRQEHQGFRAARLRNLAIAHSTADYIVFVDGDMLLHPRFIEDHYHAAQSGRFTQGVRIPLDARCTARMLAAPGTIPHALECGAGGRRRIYAIRSPALSRLLRRAANAIVAIKSCNLGVWRSDLHAVNGFNEDFVGWGPEDKELCARLVHQGVHRQTLIFAGIAFHLHHEPASRERQTANEAILARTLSRRACRCDNGLDAHLPRSAVL